MSQYWKLILSCLTISLISATQSTEAQSIQTWKSTNVEKQAPYRNFHIIGYNYSSVDDSLLLDWFKDEIREHFNYVKDIYSFQPDSNHIFQYEEWMNTSKFKTSDVIITYSISPVEFKKSKKASKYNPIIEEPYYMNLRGFFTQKFKNVEIDPYEENLWSVDIKIYHPITYNLLYSAKSKTFQQEDPTKKIKKYLEKMLEKSIHQDVINDDMD